MLRLDDFPKNELEFHERFCNEEACRDYLSSVRWPEGFVCPRCGHTEGWRRSNRDEWICAGRSCGKETSLRTGTVLHNSPKPLKAWLMAMLHMSVNKQGISALRLQRLMAFGSYETALRWLRELRRVMAATNESEKLSGEVEVDETFIGKTDEGRRGTVGQFIIIGAVEKRGAGCGRTRLRWIRSRDGDALSGFVEDVVEKGSIVLTDGAGGYKYLGAMGFLHDQMAVTDGHGRQLKTADAKVKSTAHLPQIHRVFSLVGRIVMGAYQGSLSARHLQGYLDEYCFRFNRRHAETPFTICQKIVARTMMSKCMPLWKSRGRTHPDKPTMAQSKEWINLGSKLVQVGYVG